MYYKKGRRMQVQTLTSQATMPKWRSPTSQVVLPAGTTVNLKKRKKQSRPPSTNAVRAHAC